MESESYQRGGPEDQVSFAQHDIQWIQPGFPDEGKLMLFNNGNGRETLYSSVDVIETPINGYVYDIDSVEPFGQITYHGLGMLESKCILQQFQAVHDYQMVIP